MTDKEIAALWVEQTRSRGAFSSPAVGFTVTRDDGVQRTIRAANPWLTGDWDFFENDLLDQLRAGTTSSLGVA